jgi:hypothetical protein
MKFGALLLLSALSVLGQTPAFEIHGNVSEPGLGGIAGAEVRAQVPRETASLDPPQFITTFTDGRGDFVLRTTIPGIYVPTALREGYGVNLLANRPGPVTVDRDHPSVSVQINLVRPAEIVGRVLDAETREPIADIDVFILQKGGGTNGSGWSPALLLPAREALKEASQKTDNRGNFSATGLMPNAYAAMVVRRDRSPWDNNYSPEDFKIIDQLPEPVMWPGGTPMNNTRPIPVGSGAVVSFGDILVKKVPHYRAHVSLAQGSCPVGESMRVTVSGRPRSDAVPQVFPCGSELLLRDLDPGTYYLYAVSDWQGYRDHIENAAWASAQFEITDKNAEVVLTPQPGVVLEGQLLAAEGFTLPESVVLGAQPMELAPGFQPAPEQFVEWLPGGKFRMAVSTRPQYLSLPRGGRFFVKQAVYNGSPLQGSKLDVNPGAGAQRLVLTLDDKFGSITGTVTAGGTNRAIALLWAEDVLNPILLEVANGTFRSDVVPPGEYRVSAASIAVLGEMTPTLLERVNAGEKITIRAGETTTINVPAPATSR